MSGRQQGGSNNPHTESPPNPRHQESYWEGRADPREGYAATDKGMMFTNNYYKVLDRQIAADNHARSNPNPQQGSGSGNATAGSAQKK